MSFWAEHVLLPTGWARRVRLTVLAGRITAVVCDADPAAGDHRLGTVVPGLGNLHSHAFQRGMAGLTELGGTQGDSFWSWRELMYRFLDRLDPDSFQAIAELAYMEMLEAGFTRVGEFHYLHHDVSGAHYADRAEMCGRLAAAAGATGIGLTLLPVIYAHSDFGAVAATTGQRRFLHDLEGFAGLMEGAAKALQGLGDAVLGVAPHSLRAVAPAHLSQLPALCAGPVHIHIAEQVREVQACLSWSGQRPVQWLYENVDVGERWCLVHATHVDQAELQSMAGSGVVVGLCPITEANLGDGLFPIRDFARLGGRFGVGSDSNVDIDAGAELCLLEYGQRLQLRARNVLAPPSASSGRWLFEQAGLGAAQALGVEAGLVVGASADFVELELNHSALVHREGDALLDSWVFAGRNAPLRSVWRQGRQWVHQGRHLHRDIITTRYSAAMGKLLAR